MSRYASCELTSNVDCPTVNLSYTDDVYCCAYVLGNPHNLDGQLSQQGLFNAVTLVRDLNIASLVSDYVFVIVALCIFGGLYQQSGDITKAKRMTLILTALGSLIDVCITFTIVGILDQNHLVNGMADLYENHCYSPSLDRTILDLENQFQTVLILDVVEGILDIISLSILACGTYFRCNDDNSEFATCSEGIHTFMFAVFDVIIISTNVFVFVLPSYAVFKDAYNDGTKLCFKHIRISTMAPHLMTSTMASHNSSTPAPTWDPELMHVELRWFELFFIIIGALLFIGGIACYANYTQKKRQDLAEKERMQTGATVTTSAGVE
eukprot:839507_1